MPAETLLIGTSQAVVVGSGSGASCFPDPLAGSPGVVIPGPPPPPPTPGAGPPVTSPGGGGAGGTTSPTLMITTDNTVIDGLTITMAMPQPGPLQSLPIGIQIIGADAAHPVRHVTIKNCVITGGLISILAHYAEDVNVINCTLSDADYGGVTYFSVIGGLIQKNTISRIGYVRTDMSSPAYANNAYGIMLNRSETASLTTDPHSQNIVVDSNFVSDVPLWMCLNSHGGIGHQFINNTVERAPRGIFVAGSPFPAGSGTVVHPQNITVDHNVILQSVIKAGGSTSQIGVTSSGWVGSAITNNQIAYSYLTDIYDYTGEGNGPSSGVVISGNTRVADTTPPMLITSSNVTVAGQNFSGTYGAGAAIYVHGTDGTSTISNVTIQNCTFSNFSVAVQAEYVVNLIVKDCIINDVLYAGVLGFSIIGGAILRNTIQRVGYQNAPPQEVNAYGIALSRVGDSDFTAHPRSSGVEVAYNLVTDIPTWEGIDTHAGDSLNVHDNTTQRCLHAIVLGPDGIGNPALNITCNANIVEQAKGNQYGLPAGANVAAITICALQSGSSVTNNQISTTYPTATYGRVYDFAPPSSQFGPSVGVTISGNTDIP